MALAFAQFEVGLVLSAFNSFSSIQCARGRFFISILSCSHHLLVTTSITIFAHHAFFVHHFIILPHSSFHNFHHGFAFMFFHHAIFTHHLCIPPPCIILPIIFWLPCIILHCIPCSLCHVFHESVIVIMVCFGNRIKKSVLESVFFEQDFAFLGSVFPDCNCDR